MFRKKSDKGDMSDLGHY